MLAHRPTNSPPMIQVTFAHGTGHAVLHTAIGLWLLFNVAWNHAFCIFTPPGCTKACDLQVCSLMLMLLRLC